MGSWEGDWDREPDLDLGSGHTLRWTTWDPDPELNPQWADLPPQPAGTHHGAIVGHRKPDGSYCEGGITFETERSRRGSFKMWQVQSWDPLTVSPSLLCRACGDHGFIRDGRWVSV